MTNGEKIKELFPHFDVEDKTEYFGRIRNLDDHFIKADIDFWNAEYKEPKTKNDLGVDKFDKAINQSDLEEWIMETFPDWCVGDVRQIMNHMDEMPSVTPQEPILDKIFCIAHPLSIMSTPELEHKAIMQIAEMLEPLCLPESEG